MDKKKVLVVVLMLSLALSACNFPLAFDDPEKIENAVAETVAAYEVEEEVVVPTLALLPTSTPMPLLTAEPAATEDSETTEEPEPTKVLCNSAQFIYETVPDNTKYAPGTAFDKGWTLRNVGYCTWSAEYKLAFESGDKMNGPDAKAIGVEVKPNGEVEIVLSLTAPSTVGTYRGYWVLQTADGADIGPMWVQIVVE